METKRQIRERMRKWRRSLGKAEQKEKDEKIRRSLESLECFQRAHHILCYWSVEGEPDTHALIERHSGKKSLYLPKTLEGGKMVAVPISAPLKLEKGIEGILEPPFDPQSGQPFDPPLDLVLVPGLAFDRQGNRLGRGKGYYDRYLKRVPHAVLVGLAYDGQVLDQVPKDLYDVRVHWVVTERGPYPIKDFQ